MSDEVRSPVPVFPTGAACAPNVSASGRRRRFRFGVTVAIVAGISMIGFVLGRVAWPWRVLVGLPTMASALSFLQAARHTCVARAAEGTFENEDFSKIRAPDEEVAASRQVAAGILRESALIGVGGSLAGLATALIR